VHICFAHSKVVFRVETLYVNYLPLTPIGWSGQKKELGEGYGAQMSHAFFQYYLDHHLLSAQNMQRWQPPPDKSLP
jgi:hypothetical protein